MQPNNYPILESKHLKKRVIAEFDQGKKGVLSCFDEDYLLRPGSTLPKLNSTAGVPKRPIKPPSTISANPFLKAAGKLDLQTASIPWDDFAFTLKNSKSNFARIKEIYRPEKSYTKKFEEKVKNKVKKKIIINRNYSCDINHSSHKSLDLDKTWQALKIVNYDTHSLHESSFTEKNLECVGTHFLNLSQKPNFFQSFSEAKLHTAPTNKRFKIKKHEKNSSSTKAGQTQSFYATPFVMVLKGNKIKSSSGNMFVRVKPT